MGERKREKGGDDKIMGGRGGEGKEEGYDREVVERVMKGVRRKREMGKVKREGV